MTARETVVGTGLGATTPLGGDVASTWSAMLAGRSGVRSLTEPWAESLPVRFAAEAAADPVNARPACRALATAMRAESRRLICPAPIPTVVCS